MVYSRNSDIQYEQQSGKKDPKFENTGMMFNGANGNNNAQVLS